MTAKSGNAGHGEVNGRYRIGLYPNQEGQMHAVVVKVTITDLEESQRSLKEELVPRVKQAPGFVTGTWARKDNSGMSMVLFESEDQARAAAEMVRSGERAGVTIDDVEVREVVVHV